MSDVPRELIGLFVFAFGLIVGSIYQGWATPTEAAAVGAVGATLLTIANKKLNMATLHEVMHTTTRLTCMVFIILCGAAAFGLVFRGLGGDAALGVRTRAELVARGARGVTGAEQAVDRRHVRITPEVIALGIARLDVLRTTDPGA